MRGIVFLEQREDQHLRIITKAGWTKERLEALCDLVSFHQIVVGPLASSARTTSDSGLGSKIGIAYGAEMHFDRSSAKKFREMSRAFSAMSYKHGIREWWLISNDVRDLVFRISQSLDEE